MFHKQLIGLFVSILIGLSAMPTCAATTIEQKVKELERRIEILTKEYEKQSVGPAAGGKLKSYYGLGPAASKVYTVARGFSLAGYGEMLYQNFSKTRENGSPIPATVKNELDFLRQILYLGYKFRDDLLFNSEIEFEHGSAGPGRPGEVSVEFAYIDWLWRNDLNFRTGMVLIPMGLVNELHEPPIFTSARRPFVESSIIPTTWRANGIGFFGNLKDLLSYRFFLVEGLDATKFTASGIRGGRQFGAKAKVEDIALTARVDLNLTPGSFVGASFFSGGSGQGQIAGTSAPVQIADLHGKLVWKNWEIRGLAAVTLIGDAQLINANNSTTGTASVGSQQYGAYLEVSHDLLSDFAQASLWSLSPFIRYEQLNTQWRVPTNGISNPANHQQIWTLGLRFKPDPNVAFKVDYQNITNGAQTGVSQLNASLGYMF